MGPGDGSDSVDGQGGNDLVDFFGSNIGELIEVSAIGGRVELTRNVASVVMSIIAAERLSTHLFGGADQLTVNSLAGTPLKTVDTDLSALDGAAISRPTPCSCAARTRATASSVTASGPQVLVSGLAALVRITGQEVTHDTLRIETFLGDDDLTISPDVTSINIAADLGADG